jgi:hypothetical protein
MKKYTEKQIWSLMTQLDWSTTICDHETCYGQMTIQVSLGRYMPYFGEFLQDTDGLFTFAFYTYEK